MRTIGGVLNGILWIDWPIAPWRALPRRYGPVGTVSRRYEQIALEAVRDRARSTVRHATADVCVCAQRLGDKTDSSPTAHARSCRRHIRSVIPANADQPHQPNFDRKAYHLPNRSGRLINRLKRDRHDPALDEAGRRHGLARAALWHRVGRGDRSSLCAGHL